MTDTTPYLPLFLHSDTGLISSGIDSFRSHRSNHWLRLLNQPILYNYYLGEDMYRFTSINSFGRSLMLTLHLDKSNSRIDFLTYGEDSVDESINLPLRQKMKIDSNYYIIEYKPITIDDLFCRRFEEILDSSNFWKSIPYDKFFGLDGSRWLLESHLRKKYWFHSEWSPEGSFKPVGDYLMKKIYQ